MYINAFKSYDKNGDGVMDEKEFKNIMIDIGHRKITDEECKQMLAAQDKNSDGVLQWNEFIDMMVAMKGTDDKNNATTTKTMTATMTRMMTTDN